jgi:methionyl-tRNA formyltransferase
MNISVLCTDSRHPIVPLLRTWCTQLSSLGQMASLYFDKAELPGGDILFLVSCGQLLKSTERRRYQATLVLHASDLPRGRGWSPHIWAILEGASRITVSLLEAADEVDCGPVWLKTTFDLEGHELIEEINEKLFAVELQLMTAAIKKFGLIKPLPQVGNPGKYLPKRTPKDSQIDPHKSIVEQFNLLRIVDPDRYPAFFEHKGIKYLLKLEKVKNE